VTFSAWFSKTAMGTTEGADILSKNDGVDGFLYYLYKDGLSVYQTAFYNFDTAQYGAANTSSYDDENWNYITWVRAATGNVADNKIYLNGNSISFTNNAEVGSDFVDSSFNLLFAKGYTAARYFEGSLDEIRMAKVIRSEGWVKASYNNQNSPSTFYSLGSETEFVVSATWTAGKFGSTISFDGTDDYIDVGNINSEVKTISFWVQADSTSENIIDLNGGGHTILASSGVISASGFSSPVIYVDGVVASTIDTSWHHVLISSDTPADVKAATIQNKANEIVEAIAKQKAETQSFAVYHQHLDVVQTEPVSFVEGTLFNPYSEQAKKEFENIERISSQTIELRNIPIPRLILLPNYGEMKINNFDLNTSKLSTYATHASILEERLQGSEQTDLFGNTDQGARDTILTQVSHLGGGRTQSPENTIIAALTDYPLIDYEEQKALLLKLAKQAVAFYKSFVGDEKTVKMMVENNFRQIAKEIYDQILECKEFISDGYLESGIREPKPYLEQYNISYSRDEKPVTLKSQIDRFSREKIYTGFKKACHSMYRFDSSDEARMAYLLDKDSTVEDWLRPAPNQFEGLFWRDEMGDSQRRYEPDFVVEFEKEIVMIEVKPSDEMESHDVQEKKKTSEKYCDLVTKNIGDFGIVKPWRYVIVPTEKITISSTVGGLLAMREKLI
ncbi:MAG: LamG domain-containing protein, partial [Firmicutes bacterium]|nr:LamG domain-containing protein [Bacillota bacterium]